MTDMSNSAELLLVALSPDFDEQLCSAVHIHTEDPLAKTRWGLDGLG